MQLPMTMTSSSEVPVRVLIINPNTSQHMTDALKPVIDALGFENVSLSLIPTSSRQARGS